MSRGFEPVSLGELKRMVLDIIPGGDAVGRQLSSLRADQGDRVKLIGLASLLLFMYERGRNPGINTIADAALYCSTALAAGHCPAQPVTTVGKLVGTLLLALGKEASPRQAASDERVVGALEAILKELRERPPSPPRELAPPQTGLPRG